VNIGQVHLVIDLVIANLIALALREGWRRRRGHAASWVCPSCGLAFAAKARDPKMVAMAMDRLRAIHGGHCTR
jgi:hypothetical protein